jgi:hypothetical protein
MKEKNFDLDQMEDQKTLHLQECQRIMEVIPQRVLHLEELLTKHSIVSQPSNFHAFCLQELKIRGLFHTNASVDVLFASANDVLLQFRDTVRTLRQGVAINLLKKSESSPEANQERLQTLTGIHTNLKEKEDHLQEIWAKYANYHQQRAGTVEKLQDTMIRLNVTLPTPKSTDPTQVDHWLTALASFDVQTFFSLIGMLDEMHDQYIKIHGLLEKGRVFPPPEKKGFFSSPFSSKKL